MRILLFALMVTFFACGSETKTVNQSPTNTTTSPTGTVIKYKKTATNSEFAVYRTISANDQNMEYYFKTLDGISLKFIVSHEGEPEVKVPENLLEHAKYLEGFPGANPEMAGRVFEIIYDKDNYIAEVKLAEVEK